MTMLEETKNNTEQSTQADNVGLSALFCGCTHNFIYDGDCIVKAVKDAEGFRNYKYQVDITGFPTTQILYTNQKYQVGDTVKFSK
jgi:hypothetical protein